MRTSPARFVAEEIDVRMRVIRWLLLVVTVVFIIVDVLTRHRGLILTAASARCDDYVLLGCGNGLCALYCSTGVPDPPPGIKPGISVWWGGPVPGKTVKGGHWSIVAHPLNPVRAGTTTYWVQMYVGYPWLVPLCLTCVACLPSVYRLLRRRHRIRAGHCASCGYSLIGNASGRCPECGQVANIKNAGIPTDRIEHTCPSREPHPDGVSSQ